MSFSPVDDLEIRHKIKLSSGELPKSILLHSGFEFEGVQSQKRVTESVDLAVPDW